ncbi:hypothetical protein L9F63_007230, partial [Diploptera punctata]
FEAFVGQSVVMSILILIRNLVLSQYLFFSSVTFFFTFACAFLYSILSVNFFFPNFSYYFFDICFRFFSTYRSHLF